MDFKRQKGGLNWFKFQTELSPRLDFYQERTSCEVAQRHVLLPHLQNQHLSQLKIFLLRACNLVPKIYVKDLVPREKICIQ